MTQVDQGNSTQRAGDGLSLTVPTNYAPARNGMVRAVCQCCGKQSRPVAAEEDGEPKSWHLAAGWSTAPFFADTLHDDGSKGSFFTCPTCNKRLHKGETLKLRSYMGGNLCTRMVS